MQLNTGVTAAWKVFYCALRLRTDEQSSPKVTLFDFSNWGGMCIHVSVADVIHKVFTAIKGRKCL